VRGEAPPRRRLVAVAVLALSLLTADASWARGSFQRLHADDAPVSEAELRRLEAVFSDAFNRRDAATLDLLLAEDFLFTSEQGAVSNKAQYIDFVVNHIRVVSGGISDLVVRVYDDAAVVVGRFDGVSVIDGQQINDTFRFTDVWVRRHDRWYVIASQSSPIPH
jgi:ketosteroid isomerase-like protein